MSCFQLTSPSAICDRMKEQKPSRLVDVRGLDEFAAMHVEGAVCTPLPRLLDAASTWPPDEEVLLICHSGQRAREAAVQLAEAGFERLSVVEGGTQACAKAGVPVVRGKKRIPIQRQVMIIAGLLVLAGLSLAYLHPAFVAVSWFVSAGLVFAGTSGICPMARVLAMAPWNKTDTGKGAGQAGASCSAAGGCS